MYLCYLYTKLIEIFKFEKKNEEKNANLRES